MPSRYVDRESDRAVRTISNANGTLAGPPGGDGWAVISRLRQSRLPAGNLAVWVTGRISNLQVIGQLPTAAPAGGHVQVCLADSNGTRSPVHIHQVNVAQSLPIDEAQQFTFLLVFSSADGVTDPTWGSAWPGTSELQIHGRLFYATDPTTYSVTFDVSDVEWVWLLIDNLPAADRHVFVDDSPKVVTGTTGVGSSSAGDVTALDEQWLHFGAAYLEPGRPFNTGEQTQVSLKFGLGTVTHLQALNAGQVGATRKLGVPWEVFVFPGRLTTFGVFWHSTGDGNESKMSWRAFAEATALSETTVLRVRVVSIRLDTLEGVQLLSFGDSSELTEYLQNQFTTTRYVLAEIGTEQLSWEPYVFASMSVRQQANPQRVGHGLYLRDDSGEIYVVPERFVVMDARPDLSAYPSGRVHQHQLFLSSSNGIGYGDPGFQYRLSCLKPGSGAVHHDAVEIYLAVFHPIFDPDGQAPTVPAVGDPVALVPGAEGPATGTLPQLALMHDAAMSETELTRPERMVGSTGYSRTWGVFLKPRRTFRLTWGPVTTAQKDTLVTELRAAKLWRMTPPGDSEIAVAGIRDVQASDLGRGTHRVDFEVAELVYQV